ncbi:hypothetical protein V6R21_25600 [Limibacter armeniacum]|uniref:hypothetical protein n=1 Tax=Limibacter armeniacum TaxID=466084 RepID=UPI002FE5E70A
MKTLLRIFISLCIILLSGLSQLYANTDQDRSALSEVKVLDSSYQTNLGKVQSDIALHIKATQSGKKKAPNKGHLLDIEEEENESSHSKKNLEYNKDLHTAFYIHSGLFSYYTEKFTPYKRHFSYFPTYSRYLKFRVLRI